jgi:hypothetical protein
MLSSIISVCFLVVLCVLAGGAFEYEEDSLLGVRSEDWERFYHPLPVSDPITYYARCGRYDAKQDRKDSTSGRVHLFAEFERVQRETLVNISLGLPYKAVVFVCDSATPYCGGLGDRMRGAISAFFLAIVTKRAFFMRSLYPVDLGKYVRPLRREFASWSLPLDWNRASDKRPALVIKEVGFTTWLERTTEYQEFSERLKRLPLEQILEDNDVLFLRTNVYFAWHTAVYHKSKRELSLLGHLQRMSHADNLPYCLMNYLFHPTQPVLEKLARIPGFSSRPLVDRNETFVAIHIRVGARRFNDPARVPADTLNQFLACAKARRELLLRNYPQLRAVRYFIASDEPELIERASEVVGPANTIRLRDDIIHLDNTFSSSWGTREFNKHRRAQAARGVMRLMIEHLLLAGAAEMVLSPSGFGYWSYARRHTLALRDRRREYPFAADPYTACREMPPTEEIL